MIFPWAHRLISAGAHGLRRIPGQSVNLAHLIWRAPRAPAPLQGATPVVFRAGLWVLGVKSPFSPFGTHRRIRRYPVNGEALRISTAPAAASPFTGKLRRSR